ncbi:MAG TPA: hypothetical protein VF116_05365 [Ktedonobacterales bacterium]
MGDKFNFYDFVGYIIPGAAVLALIYWLYVGMFHQPADLAVDSLGDSIIFLAAAYFAGHVVQALSRPLAKRLAPKAFDEQYSKELLSAKNSHFTEVFKADLVKAIGQVFNVSVTLSDDAQDRPSQSVAAETRAEAFALCYALIVQQSADTHTALFDGIYGLLRGMFMVLCLAIPVAAAIIIRNTPAGDRLQWGLGTAVLVAAILALPPVISRAKSFSEQFAQSVYLSFYAWYSAKQPGGSGGSGGA